MLLHKIISLILYFCGFFSFLQSQQITIDRIEQMPDLPQPYHMRNWKQVTAGYDSLVFDLNATGQYLPLVWTDGNSVNYPEHDRFGLHTIVGQPEEKAAEAINVIPAVISATLIGIDKSNQNGRNWVLMCEEFFNNRKAENVYLNNFVGNSGNDWWYDVMPNVFFYQLNYFYPQVGHFADQFTKVADRWTQAVVHMGGNTTPWRVPDMNYRGWYLATMTPNASGVREPEAAGALAWIFYNAYKETGREKYRISAEWSMEFLNDFPENPFYELQLPYGVYTAARMNAELGTSYNVERLLIWCFTTENNRRNWGATLGRWGDYDCAGLIGEAKPAAPEGYAFFMNGVEQFGALLPMLRYDDRFANTLGKWALNLANASRLFYPNYLPDSLQDSESWSYQYDPNSYIAHEALREKALNQEKRPFATGDFIRNSWGPTNLALYGSSHVGILGGIIDTTNVEGILKLNLLKTDYYHAEAYPTYLCYNPHPEEKTIQIEIYEQSDIYDAVTNSLIMSDVQGQTDINIPAKTSRILVLIPSGSEIEYELNKTLANEIVIDYNSGTNIANNPPRIKTLATNNDTLTLTDSTKIYCTAEDREDPENELEYNWSWFNDGSASGKMITWTAPEEPGIYQIYCQVIDSYGDFVVDTISISVQQSINNRPKINRILANKIKIEPGSESRFECVASDPDNDSLSYSWSSRSGQFTTADSITYWQAPNEEGVYYINCQVSDGRGGTASDSVRVAVKIYNEIKDVHLIAYYPFEGNASDSSGFQHNGNVYEAQLVQDKDGNQDQAYYFDGDNDLITVPNSQVLNVEDSITICYWMKAATLYNDRESYVLSHGNWQNRWKISIIPEKKLRWTVNTGAGIKDLDSEMKLEDNEWYYIITSYNRNSVRIFINGELDSQSGHSGKINKTDINLTIGQALPSEDNYNFNGTLDAIRIYNTALDQETISGLYSRELAVHHDQKLPNEFHISQNYPNPFNPTTKITYRLPKTSNVKLQIFDLNGRLVKTLVDEQKGAGKYEISWDSKNISSGIYFYRIQAGDFSTVKKCIKLK